MKLSEFKAGLSKEEDKFFSAFSVWVFFTGFFVGLIAFALTISI